MEKGTVFLPAKTYRHDELITELVELERWMDGKDRRVWPMGWNVKCNITRVEYDVISRRGVLFLPKDNVPSMSPTIGAFMSMDPEVQQIAVFSGGLQIAKYMLQADGEWVSVQWRAISAHPLDHIAKVCHEANRALCQAFGDTSQPAWEDAPAWQRESARMGVDLQLMGDFGPEASHIAWMQQKLLDGWKYGPEKDVARKEHPCMVPFGDLPAHQQAKDFVFRAIVHTFKEKESA